MMKVFILLTTVFALSMANEILDVKNMTVKNLKSKLDKKLVDKILNKYEAGEITALINEYSHTVFMNIENYALENNLDPLALDDMKRNFLESSITLTNGRLSGIATIDRADDVTISYSSDARTLEIDLPIIFTNLAFAYDYHVVILLIGPKGSLEGAIHGFRINIKLQFDFNTYHVKVTELTTSNKGHLALTFHGNGVVDVVVNILTEFATTVLQPLIAQIIHKTVTDVGDKVVQVANDAIDDFLNPDNPASAGYYKF
ncbi:uncharacterized protein LOC108917602 [Anoplophora glabripennis]|uniref:uncharacterized protein LOC108917602 n=1 Tax=Anoplophora glabripennis TaxID=217634 RepID=UPI0008735919|nr:uncharacterized protein LOC108917602 [Anoplophora glabripennis]